MSDSPLRLENVSHFYGTVQAVRDFTMEIRPGEFVALVGPSGCGKSTLLNLLAGSFQPTHGTVKRSGEVRRVYQSDGLYPWLTVGQNISLGLGQISDSKKQREQLLDLLKLIGLERFENHFPHQLSGGMRQRVEMARAIGGNVDVLLMDEPFSALDYQTRLRMRRELVRILEERPQTVIFVTHDIEEAAQLADRVAVLTGLPAHIDAELRLDIPKPRALNHPEVIEAVHTILNKLGLEDDGASLPIPV